MLKNGLEFQRSVNQTTADFPSRYIHQLMEDQVKINSDATALIFENERLTYDQLNQRANQLAHYLIQKGVQKDSPIGVCMERSLEMVIALYGILKAGGAYVPVDPSYPRSRKEYIVQETGMTILITQSHLAETLNGLKSEICIADSPESNLDQFDTNNPNLTIPPNSLAYIIYTSGSTGRPKGVMIEHRSILNRIQWVRHTFPLTKSDCVLQKTPYSFDVSVVEFFWPLACGASLLIARPDGHRDPDYIYRLIISQNITHIHFVPSMFSLFLQHPKLDHCNSLKRVFCSGEALNPDLVHRFFKQFPHTELHNFYGPTEAAVDVSWWACKKNDSKKNIPIGKPIANTQLYILDPHGQPTEPGEPGELYIGGVQVARGYVQQPQLTAERFIPDPFSNNPNGRLYRTGDICQFDSDGNIEYLGRADNQVKIRGLRIELGEIEAILRKHPAVLQAAVVCRNDLNDPQTLVGYIVSKGGQPVDHVSLQDHLSQYLPQYMIPTVFMRLSEMPLITSGKLDRKALPKPNIHIHTDSHHHPPETETEIQLAQFWKDILGIDRIGRNDNFFNLGGHSLKAIEVSYKIQSFFNINCPVSWIFEFPTLSKLANQVESHSKSPSLPDLDTIKKVDRERPIPLSFAQKRMWLLQQASPNLPIYNIGWMILLEGTLNHTALELSLQNIIARHESLRTTFKIHQGEPMQFISPPTHWSLPVVQVKTTKHRTFQDDFYYRVEVAAKQRFNLEKGPLYNIALLQGPNQQAALQVIIHHLITDGWSQGIFARELSCLYNYYCQPNWELLPKPELGELPVQYADYGCWQKDNLPNLLKQDWDYWKEQLASPLPEVTLPTDYPRPPVNRSVGKWLWHHIPDSLYNRLQQFCLQEHCTIYNVLLAAYYILLHRYTSQSDILIGLPIACRTHREINNILGFFVNTVLSRSTIHPNNSCRDILNNSVQQNRLIQKHQNLPYDLLVEKINPTRHSDKNVFFQTMLAYQDARYWQLDVTNLKSRTVEIPTGTSKLDLLLFAEENPEGMTLRTEFNTDLYRDDTIRKFMKHYQALLEQIIVNPNQPVGKIDFLDREEKHLLRFLGDNRQAPIKHNSIHQRFEHISEKYGDTIALKLSNNTLSYKQLNGQANQLARILIEGGVKPNSRVAICLERGFETIIAQLATLKAGGAYVPMDLSYPPQRLQFMIQDCKPAVFITDTAFMDQLGELSCPVLCWNNLQDRMASHTNNNLCLSTHPDSLAYIMYTSGSTGQPKGVAIPHQGVIRLVTNQNYILFGSDRRFLQLAPVSFDASTFEIWGPLLHGGCCVLYPERVPELDTLGEIISEYQIDTLWLTASLFNLIIDQSPDILQPIRFLLTGGEALSVPHVRKALSLLDNTQLINGYGPTESTTFTCCYPIPRELPDTLKSIPIGNPIVHTDVRVVDRQNQPVPIGVWGQLLIGGEGLAQEYWNRPELTKKAFITIKDNPNHTTRYYQSGDICRWRYDGVLEFGGRQDGQIKLRGFRIEIGEIEHAMRSHPEVSQAVVIQREDEPGQPYLAGYYVEHKEASLSPEDLRNYLSERLIEYMVPTTLTKMESLPLNANGKIDPQKLAQPEHFQHRIHNSSFHNSYERIVSTIWKDILGTDRIGRNDNFFNLGGHSLMAVSMLYQIRQKIGVHLPLNIIFESPTLKQLAQRIRQAENEFISKDIVLMKPAENKPGIFYLPGIGGYTLSFYHLTEHLQVPLAQYGLNLPGLDGKTKPCTTIAEIAAHFIKAIQNIQPNGPYYLCGYSLGGRIGYEMAIQLQQAGQPIGLLAMIGATAPGLVHTSSNVWIENYYRFCDFMRLPLKKKMEYLQFRREYQQQQKETQKERVPIQEMVPDYHSFIQVRKHSMTAWHEYHISHRFNGPLLLIRETAIRNPLYRQSMNHPSLGWDRYINGPITVCDIPCSHLEMFKEPYVKQVASALQQEILRSTIE